MRNHLVQLTVICTFLASSAHAADKQTPVAAFGLEAAQAQYLCHMEAASAISKSETAKYQNETVDAHAPIGQCTLKARETVKPLLKKALAFAAKKPGAVKAIKDYYIAWIASLSSLAIETNDSQRSWDTRQSEAERRNSEMWSRVQLEMDL